jgi:GNAT superfamily N-acetyltransferase
VEGAHDALIDTAVSINAATRQPTQAEFIPIGHIALDSKNQKAKKIDLDIPAVKVFWITSFFVLPHHRGQGIGRAAMDEIERIAIQEPLCAKTLMLDTVEGKDQLREEFAKVTYGRVPKVNLTVHSQLDVEINNKFTGFEPGVVW